MNILDESVILSVVEEGNGASSAALSFKGALIILNRAVYSGSDRCFNALSLYHFKAHHTRFI